MKYCKAAGCAVLLLLVIAAGLMLGRELRQRGENVLCYDEEYTHCICITNLATGETDAVMDVTAHETRRAAQSIVWDEAIAEGVSEDELMMRYDAVPLIESQEVLGDKRALREIFRLTNLLPAEPDDTAHEWQYELEFILRDHTNTRDPAFGIGDDIHVYVDETGVLVQQPVYFELRSPFSLFDLWKDAK